LYVWKQRHPETLYKCPNDQCPAYLKAQAKLNPAEKKLQQQRSSQFKLRYQYREYHFSNQLLQHAAPQAPTVNLAKIHSSPNVLGLVLAFHVSFALPARKTAQILAQVFQIKLSYQTVLNYAEAAAYYCHRFNFAYKGEIDPQQPGDETYIKIAGKNAYTFFFISAKSLKITAYQVAHSREVLPAAVAIAEATRTAKPNQQITLFTDGNPAYAAAILFLNAHRDPHHPILHRQIIGLQNLDEQSELYRHFKQLIERLNRTYRYHTRSANGFKADNGAISYTTLFTTHYNFLRPHMSLNYQVPIPRSELQTLQTIQEKWCRIIDLGSQIDIEQIRLQTTNWTNPP
jgi:transposase-like protein